MTTTIAEGAKENQKFPIGARRLMMINRSDLQEADLLLILSLENPSETCRMVQEIEDFPDTSSRHKRDSSILSKMKVKIMADQVLKEDATQEEINEV
jgi:hypothetical protein